MALLRGWPKDRFIHVQINTSHLPDREALGSLPGSGATLSRKSTEDHRQPPTRCGSAQSVSWSDVTGPLASSDQHVGQATPWPVAGGTIGASPGGQVDKVSTRLAEPLHDTHAQVHAGGGPRSAQPRQLIGATPKDDGVRRPGQTVLAALVVHGGVQHLEGPAEPTAWAGFGLREARLVLSSVSHCDLRDFEGGGPRRSNGTGRHGRCSP